MNPIWAKKIPLLHADSAKKTPTKVIPAFTIIE